MQSNATVTESTCRSYGPEFGTLDPAPVHCECASGTTTFTSLVESATGPPGAIPGVASSLRFAPLSRSFWPRNGRGALGDSTELTLSLVCARAPQSPHALVRPRRSLEMADAAPQIVWDAIRKHHSAVVRRGGATFSAEKGNLRNKHAFKWSGLAQRKVVSVHEVVTVSDKGTSRKAVMTVATTNTNKPAVSQSTTAIEGRMSAVKGIHAVNAATYGDYYRPDLRSAALARFAALRASRATRARGARSAVSNFRSREEQVSYDHLDVEE
jgi:large subunit ribosomal protein L28e